MRSLRLLMVIVPVAMIVSSEARGGFAAGPRLNPANGHYYGRVDDSLGNIPWTDARDQAKSLTYLSRNGHLATLTSADENEWVVKNLLANIPNDDTAWIGAFQPPSSPEPAGGFRWVTGEPFKFTNWNAGEPNESTAPTENSIEMYVMGDGIGKWNDAPNDDPFITPSYFVEFERPRVIPLPAAIWPGLSILGGLFVRYTVPPLKRLRRATLSTGR